MAKFKPILFGGEIPVFDYSHLKSEQIFANTGNTGNMAFRSAIYKHLGRKCPTVTYSKLKDYNQLEDRIAIIPCANHLGKHSESFGENRLKHFNNIKVPMLAIGLGAQSKDNQIIPDVPENVIKWLNIIVENAPSDYPNISVRGEFTKKVLDHINFKDQSIVLGCPSLFLNDEKNLGKIIEKNIATWPPKRIAISGGNPLNPRYEKVEAAFAKLITQHQGAYIVQHPLEMIKMARGEFNDLDNSMIKKTNNILTPELDRDNFYQWCRMRMRVFFDVYAWMEYLRGFDFVFGTRIHGTMLALQAGVPALCITHDSRTQELCDTMNIPNISVNELDIDNLTLQSVVERLSFNSTEFDDNRKLLAHKYVTFLRKNKTPICESLINIAK